MPDHHTTARPHQPESLRDLCAAAARGDRAAFEQIHRRLAGGLWRMLHKRTGGRSDITDDLAQRAWMAVWQALCAGKYDPERSAITTFVYAVGYKTFLTHLRTASRADAVATDFADHADAPASAEGEPADAISLAESLDTMRAILRGDAPGEGAGLTIDERDILRSLAEGESDRSLARRLGLAASTVNARKHAAYDKIRAYLASRTIPRTPSGERDRPANE